MDYKVSILGGFVPREQFAEANDLTARTVDRYRAEGLPWVKWGTKIYIGPLSDARQWLERRVRRTEGRV